MHRTLCHSVLSLSVKSVITNHCLWSSLWLCLLYGWNNKINTIPKTLVHTYEGFILIINANIRSFTNAVLITYRRSVTNMGGSRCSYRNCSMRSGVSNVHMFHYPVYDKKRCHQWLANAQKFEFLNLKLSQLRNRIVCQYHFKDECFMNYLKDRLTFHAVPTEDGPFCESNTDNTEAQGAANVYSLILNENEGDDKYIKKNKSSVIYADFLTNGDVWEKQSLNETIWNNKVITNKSSSRSVNSKNIDVPPKIDTNESSLITLPKTWPEEICTKITEFENPILSEIKYTTNENNSSRNTRTSKIKQSCRYRNSNHEFNNLLVNQEPVATTVAIQNSNDVPINQDLNDLLLNQENNNVIANVNDLSASNNIIIEQITDLKWPDKQDSVIISENNNKQFQQPTEMQYSEISMPNPESLLVIKTHQVPIYFESNNYESKQDLQRNSAFEVEQVNQNLENKTYKTKKPKIKILFEEKITEPITITDKMEPMSPSMIINVSNKKEKTRSLLMRKNSLLKKNKAKVNTNITGDSIKSIDEDIKPSFEVLNSKNNEKQIETIPKIPAFKHKISPERIAAIEKKRNFNKKLRDIIEICLEKLDEQDKTSENITVTNSPKEKESNDRENSLKQNVGSYLSKQVELPNVHEYTMKFIEARMKKMEDILLSKIEDNSQRIVELKKCIAPKTRAPKSSATQTTLNEESYKKQLYQEMSKFLSPSANSLVYEELFINKYGQKISNQPASKRRKCR